ncbi:rod shape-determining protein MreC [Salinisphaera sp. PC39]|uniref:rod shape-determining protein MreC n=1 Tax=Salinisphaera sp. PC39 TaxID=1304156 RepID=UPI0033420BE2
MRGLSDDNISLFPRGPSPSIKIVLILVLSLGLMFLDHSRDTLQPVRSSLATVLQPLQIAAELPSDAADFVTHYLDRDELIAENEALSQQVLLLRARLQKLAALEAENDRIRALLSSARSLDEEVLIAEILSVSPDPYRHYVNLNKGEADGVFPGQALVDANGIMGQVTQVNAMGSTAIMITDPNHGIPVEFNRTGLQTIAQGTGKSERLLLPFLPANADVVEGDLLVSSGLGGRYPAGYPVARVSEVTHQPGDEFLTVIAEPTASLNRGREVLLVWTPQPEEPADTPPAADGPPAADESAPQ